MRHILCRLFAASLLMSAGTLANAQPNATPAAPYLRDLAAGNNSIIGTSINRGNLNNPRFNVVAAREFNSVTPENELKCAFVSGGRDSYFFMAPDYIVTWAEDHGMGVRGHTLVWHHSVPRWLLGADHPKEYVLSFLRDYITTVMTRYKGRFYAWDVVNEVLKENGTLRDAGSSYWYATCGGEYIAEAFRWARAADPSAKLFINDYGVETINLKSNGLYDLVKKLLASGVPVDGVGLQCHVTEESPPDFKSMEANIRRFIDLGLEVQLTELDVRIKGVPTPEQLKHQAEIYQRFFTLALSFPKVTGVTIWGASDAVSWIPHGAPVLFDDRLDPKPAYFAVRKTLAEARSEKNK